MIISKKFDGQVVLDKLADDLRRDIDREVLWVALKDSGWKSVIIDRFRDNKHAVDITHWLEENCKNTYQRSGREFIFKDTKYATIFILKWS